MFQESIPTGFAPSIHTIIVETIGHMVNFLDTVEKGGDFVNIQNLSEIDLQKK